MKHLLISVLTVLCAIACASAQNIEGSWEGTVPAGGGAELPIVFNISRAADGSLSATLDSPKQGQYGIAVDSISFEKQKLSIKMASIGLEYNALMMKGLFSGVCTIQGFPFTMTLSVRKSPERPQTPKPPFPYRTEEVRFTNTADNVTLAGTLSLPEGEGPWKAVVLVSGSGIQNRDEEIFEHRPFAVIADRLTRRGIAVLRYDDRGAGESDNGDVANATTANLALDAEAAVDFLLKRKDISEVSIAGHSEGGAIAFMVAARRNDIHSVISLAGPAVRGREILLSQAEALARAQGANDAQVEAARKVNSGFYDFVMENRDLDAEAFRKALSSKVGTLRSMGLSEEQCEQTVAQLSTPWMRYFICYDPAEDIRTVKCPILFLNGSKDLQVIADINLPAAESLTKGRSDVKILRLEGLNHLFQHCVTGGTDEYYSISETISTEVLEQMTLWLKGAEWVIFESDIGACLDDIVALDMLHKATDAGMVSLKAVMVNRVGDEYASLTDILNTHYKHPGLPIGVTRNGVQNPPVYSPYWRMARPDVYPEEPGFPKSLGDKETAGLPDAEKLYRKILSEAADTSVNIVSVGFPTNLARLLQSAPDEYSELNGVDLVKRKVKALYQQAGMIAENPEPEYNFALDPENALVLIDKWPTPIYFSPMESGQQYNYRDEQMIADLEAAGHKGSPLYHAYTHYDPNPEQRMWDAMCTLQLLAPELFRLKGPFDSKLGKDMVLHCTPDPQGRHYIQLPPVSDSERDKVFGFLRDIIRTGVFGKTAE